MATNTSNLSLYKWDYTSAVDLESKYDIDKTLNENWNKIDLAVGQNTTNIAQLSTSKANASDVYTKSQADGLLNGKVDKEIGKVLSANDFTNVYKNKLDGLSNYDDTEVTADITALQAENVQLKSSIEDLKNNQIEATEEGSTVTLDNCANAGIADFVLKGRTEQASEPTPDNPQDVHVVTGENSIVAQNKNLLKNPRLRYGNRGFTLTQNSDGSITLNGTNSDTEYLYFDITPQVGTYEISWLRGITFASHGADIRFIVKNANDDNLYSVSMVNKTYYNLNFTNDNPPVLLSIWIQKNNTFNNETLYFQIESGSAVTDYIAHEEQSYPISLGTMELCKIGDYQDYIYNSENKWYKHKAINKIASYDGETIDTNYVSTTGSLTTGAEIRYVLYTATEEEITDLTLLSQLNEIKQSCKTYEGTTNIALTGADLAPIAKIDYYKSTSMIIENLISRVEALESEV